MAAIICISPEFEASRLRVQLCAERRPFGR